MTKQEAIRILNEERNRFMDEWIDYGGVNEAYNMAISSLKEQETIVRCKDCKYCQTYGNGYDANCLAGHNITYIDGFCSEGKKKETSK